MTTSTIFSSGSGPAASARTSRTVYCASTTVRAAAPCAATCSCPSSGRRGSSGSILVPLPYSSTCSPPSRIVWGGAVSRSRRWRTRPLCTYLVVRFVLGVSCLTDVSCYGGRSLYACAIPLLVGVIQRRGFRYVYIYTYAIYLRGLRYGNSYSQFGLRGRAPRGVTGELSPTRGLRIRRSDKTGFSHFVCFNFARNRPSILDDGSNDNGSRIGPAQTQWTNSLRPLTPPTRRSRRWRARPWPSGVPDRFYASRSATPC